MTKLIKLMSKRENHDVTNIYMLEKTTVVFSLTKYIQLLYNFKNIKTI